MIGKNSDYEVIRSGITKPSDAVRGKDLYYRCTECGGMISSVPRENVECPCGNIFIDYDYTRFVLRDYSAIEVVRKIS